MYPIVKGMDAHINDDSFVTACVDQLSTFMDEKKKLKKI